MVETAQAAPPTQVPAPPKKHRSPAYPFISLSKAIERAKTFYDANKRHSAHVSAAIKTWGFADKSSGGQQTIGALKHYGLLVDESGSGDDRKVKLTALAFRILLDLVPDSPERATAIREAALTPKLFNELFQKWGVDLPGDDTIGTYLLRDKEFNSDAISIVIRVYKDTLEFAKLGEPDTMSGTVADKRDEAVKVGDYVQWTSQGMDRFETPVRVTGITDDGEFAQVEGSTTGLPMEQLQKVDPPSNQPPAPPVPPAPPAPPAPPKLMLGVAREVSSFTEGEAVLQWPATMSPESVLELEDWLELVVKKMKRRYGVETK
jgi:hypothetical protein